MSQVNYLRQDTERRDVLAAPLYEMLTLRYNEGMALKKGTRVKWTPASIKAFEQVKEDFANTIALTTLPDGVTPVLFCDASDITYGASVGYWDHDGALVPVDVAHEGYERNSMPVRALGLAVPLLLVGCKFQICCQTLSFMNGGLTKDRTMRGWLSELSAYMFPTLTNWLCDMLVSTCD